MRFVSILAIISLIAVSVYATEQHPVKIGNKTCMTCHADGSVDELKADPSADTEWKKSLHALMGTGCTACHGSEENFALLPKAYLCGSCHPMEVDTIKSKSTCSSCHQVHSFKAIKNVKRPHS